MGDLPARLRAEFLRLGAECSFARGNVIVAEGDRTTEVYVLLRGFVRIVNQTAAGDQTMIAIRTTGDLVGELAALDRVPRLSTAIAASAVTARVIDGAWFRAFTAEHPQVGEAVAQSVRAKFRTATRYRVAAGQASVLTRVARVLAQLVDSYGRELSTGILIDIPLPQHDVASLVGAAEKSVARAYVQLRAAGVIRARYREVLVPDVKLLHRYADGDADQPAIALTGSGGARR